MRKIKLLDYFKKYRGLSHQIAAIEMLQRQMPEELLSMEAEWVNCYDCDDGLNQPPFK
jgi:hypothetical protein